MTQQQRKQYSLLAFIISIPLIILGFVAANFFSANNTCTDVNVKILNAKEASFITKEDVLQMVKNNAPIANGVTKTKDINIKSLEQIIQANPWVSNANLYFDNSNILNIEVEQRIPVARWLNGDISQNYLDETAMVIPVTNNFGANVPIITSQELPVSLSSTNLKLQLIGLAKYIKQDAFWDAAISQININKNNEIELYTSISDQKIVFGDTNMMADKFGRLLKFYQTVTPRVGWDAYSQIDVSYKGQIVAKKTNEADAQVMAQVVRQVRPVAPRSSIVKAPVKVGTATKASTNTSSKPAPTKIVPVKPIVKKPVATTDAKKPTSQNNTSKSSTAIKKSAVNVKPIKVVQPVVKKTNGNNKEKKTEKPKSQNSKPATN